MSGAIPSPQSGVASVHKPGALTVKRGTKQPPKGRKSLPSKPKGSVTKKGRK